MCVLPPTLEALEHKRKASHIPDEAKGHPPSKANSQYLKLQTQHKKAGWRKAVKTLKAKDKQPKVQFH